VFVGSGSALWQLGPTGLPRVQPPTTPPHPTCGSPPHIAVLRGGRPRGGGASSVREGFGPSGVVAAPTAAAAGAGATGAGARGVMKGSAMVVAVAGEVAGAERPGRWQAAQWPAPYPTLATPATHTGCAAHSRSWPCGQLHTAIQGHGHRHTA